MYCSVDKAYKITYIPSVAKSIISMKWSIETMHTNIMCKDTKYYFVLFLDIPRLYEIILNYQFFFFSKVEYNISISHGKIMQLPCFKCFYRCQ